LPEEPLAIVQKVIDIIIVPPKQFNG